MTCHVMENEILFRTTPKRPHQNSESEFNLKNSNSKFASNTVGTIKGCCLKAPPFFKKLLDDAGCASEAWRDRRKALAEPEPGLLRVSGHQKPTRQCREDDVIIHHRHPKIQLRIDAMTGQLIRHGHQLCFRL